jgi:predicted NBD/HSP70 family sugar kinase
MTGEQLMAHNSAVADLYKQAAAAAAAGDPKAKAVLEKMKQDAMYHR